MLRELERLLDATPADADPAAYRRATVDEPNVHGEEDRGEDAPDAPWVHLGPEHGGQAAREAKEKST